MFKNEDRRQFTRLLMSSHHLKGACLKKIPWKSVDHPTVVMEKRAHRLQLD